MEQVSEGFDGNDIQAKKLEVEVISASAAVYIQEAYSTLKAIYYLCFLNLMYLFQHLIQLIFIKRMGRFYEFPNVTQTSDLVLFVCSITIILWYDQINKGVPVVQGVNQEQFELILLQNFTTTVNFKFQYLFSAMILCLFMKISPVIEFNQAIGPLLKIVQKMASDFMNFILIYLILVIMFSIIGNLNFHFDIPEFSTFFDSLIIIVDSSMGNFDFSIFNQIEDDPEFLFIGKIYLCFVVVTFPILILNLIIAILSNTYNIYDPKSNGLYLSKILSSRDELQYDECYGAFLTALPPLNLITLPLLPIAIFRESDVKFNKFVQVIQYWSFSMILFSGFSLISGLLIPFAFLKSLVLKIQLIFAARNSMEVFSKTVNLITFLFLGLPLMLLTFGMDCYYFWLNNFRSNLKKIVIENEPSKITMSWIKKIKMLSAKYMFNRIKAVDTVDYVTKFRSDLDINA